MSLAYKTMKSLISLKRKTKEELLDMCDVYYGAGRLSPEEYTDLVATISDLK